MADRSPSPFASIRHAKKRAFLTAYANLGVVTRAATAANVHPSSHRLWLVKDPAYAEAFELARDLAIDSLEVEADRRGRDGVERAVWYKGEQVGTERVYSDLLLIFRLKALRPERYRERLDVTGKVDVEVTIASLMAKYRGLHAVELDEGEVIDAGEVGDG